MTYENGQGSRVFVSGTITDYNPPQQEGRPFNYTIQPEDGSPEIIVAIGNAYQSDERPDWAQELERQYGGYENLIGLDIKSNIKMNAKNPQFKGRNQFYASSMEVLGKNETFTTPAVVTRAQVSAAPAKPAPEAAPAEPRRDGAREGQSKNLAQNAAIRAVELYHKPTNANEYQTLVLHYTKSFSKGYYDFWPSEQPEPIDFEVESDISPERQQSINEWKEQQEEGEYNPFEENEEE